MIFKLIYALKTTYFKTVRMPDFISRLTNIEKCNVANEYI